MKSEKCVKGKVKYTRFDEIWDSYMIGLQYKKPSKKDKKSLEWLVDSLDEMNLFWSEKYSAFE